MTVEPTAQNQSNVDFFVFGDSLSDIGNIFAKTFGIVPASPPNFQGRFSNGLLAVELLAQDLDLPLSLKTNFAIGGAKPIARTSEILACFSLADCSRRLIHFKTKRLNWERAQKICI
ncbi:MAG: hypothetical protein HC895_15400 [Leptolyngbyaceae cyanobacterium SM1_3_5]|nr:hypothetical protein [Leptolyngbyaceae cyanobacterium SM1_3_5]